jgi:hypothetical protein
VGLVLHQNTNRLLNNHSQILLDLTCSLPGVRDDGSHAGLTLSVNIQCGSGVEGVVRIWGAVVVSWDIEAGYDTSRLDDLPVL